MINNCWNCKSKIEEGSVFCMICGVEQKTVKITKTSKKQNFEPENVSSSIKTFIIGIIMIIIIFGSMFIVGWMFSPNTEKYGQFKLNENMPNVATADHMILELKPDNLGQFTNWTNVTQKLRATTFTAYIKIYGLNLSETYALLVTEYDHSDRILDFEIIEFVFEQNITFTHVLSDQFYRTMNSGNATFALNRGYHRTQQISYFVPNEEISCVLAFISIIIVQRHPEHFNGSLLEINLFFDWKYAIQKEV